jgi:hypothetical protein
MADEDAYTTRELSRLGDAINRLSDKVDNVGKDLVSQTVFELNRTEQGRRIGELEATLRAVNRMAWTAIAMGIAIPIITAVLLANLGIK